jgi:hypothetical protein
MKIFLIIMFVLYLIVQGFLFIGEYILYNEINKPAPVIQYQIQSLPDKPFKF